MSRSRTTIRRSLALGVLCLFAFARLALAGESCAFGSGGCPPAGIGAHVHDHGQYQGKVCAVQTASTQPAGTAAASDGTLHAVPPALVVALGTPAAFEAPLPLYGLRIAAPASILVTYGRLRL